jgi:hypothetical protein
MTRSRLVALPLLLLTGISGLACTGTETGNPPKATVVFGLESSDQQHFSIGSDGTVTGVGITAARIGIERLEFTQCSDQATSQVAAAQTVDLRDGEGVFELPEQSICWVELRFAARDIAWARVHAGASPELSLGMAGLTISGAPLFIEDDATPAVVFRPSTFPVTSGSKLVLSLDVARALSFDEVQQLTPDDAGALVVSVQQNAPVLTSIQQRWASSWSLYAVDGSGGWELVAPGEAQ